MQSMVVCDTQALVWDAIAPERLSDKARSALDTGEAEGTLVCADISLWEIAMLLAKERIRVPRRADEFIALALAARGIRVLPITPEIAALSQSGLFNHDDPADRLIGATALCHRALLVTSDSKLHAVRELNTLW